MTGSANTAACKLRRRNSQDGKRGYVPDGRGITYRDRYLQEGESVVLDDNPVLHLTKCLS